MTQTAGSASPGSLPRAGGVKSVHPTDMRLGAAIAARRRRLNMTQHDLALELGITYQQLQKYESGKNRISASRLWDASIVLNCDVRDFYGPVADSNLGDGPSVPALAAFLKGVYGREASDQFNALPMPMQLQIVGLLAPLARALIGGAP